jgi:hypothetical protein
VTTVSTSSEDFTGQLSRICSPNVSAKSKTIRDMLKILAFDPEWTLPSKLADNPMAWMIQINGFIVDARSMPRDVQEEAFRRGMIPYIPEPKEDVDDDESET